MRQDFAEAVRNRFRTNCTDPKMFLSFKQQRVFVRDLSDQRIEIRVETEEVGKEWDFEGMLYVNEMVASGIRDKLKKVRRTC